MSDISFSSGSRGLRTQARRRMRSLPGRCAVLLLSACVLHIVASPSVRADFTAAQISRINDAEQNMQIMFHSLRPDAAATQVQIPKGLEEYLPTMQQRMVWRDPDEGLLSEAKLWQVPSSLLYEFFEITRRTFPPEQNGSSTPPNFLVRHYEDNRFRFQMAVDRLYRARLGNSFGGRGRAVMGSLDLILKEMDSLITALSGVAGTGLSRQQLLDYQQAVVAITELTELVYGGWIHGPRGPDLVQEKVRKSSGFGAFLAAMVVLAAIFLAVYFGFRGNEQWVFQKVSDYQAISRTWAENYRKQFIAININYLVGVPFAFCTLLGLLTLNFWVLLFFMAVGAFVGVKTPGIVLGIMREARGKKIEGQLMDSLVLMSNGLKSGKDISQAFDMVSREMRPPIADEFGLMMRNYQLGTPFEEAMRGMEDRVTSKLLSYMIKAIIIQRQVGGNLTKIFDRIVENIREESKLEQKVGALTAQQKIQSVVVGIAPIVMVSIMFAVQPDTMISFYGSPIGMIVGLFCAGWLGVGMVVTNKLSKVEV
jgi:tight adherence protein B